MAEETPNYLMVSEVARRLGVAGKTVGDIVKRGELRVAGTTSAGYRLYRDEDVEALAKLRSKTPPRRGPAAGTGGRPKKKVAKVTKKKTGVRKKK